MTADGAVGSPLYTLVGLLYQLLKICKEMIGQCQILHGNLDLLSPIRGGVVTVVDYLLFSGIGVMSIIAYY